MSSKVINRFRILVAQKAMKQQQNINLSDVQRETGIAWSTLNSWANNQVTRYDSAILVSLCDYFNCQVGDLLVLVSEDLKQ